jgi:low affinity Fe/Cu permease
MERESSNDRSEAVAGPALKAKPKWTLTLIVALSILVGILLTLLAGGAYYHFQAGAAQVNELVNELAATKEELKHKTVQIGQLEVQIAALSSQMHALKEFAVAKASAAVAAAAASSAVPAESTDNPKK